MTPEVYIFEGLCTRAVALNYLVRHRPASKTDKRNDKKAATSSGKRQDELAGVKRRALCERGRQFFTQFMLAKNVKKATKYQGPSHIKIFLKNDSPKPATETSLCNCLFIKETNSFIMLGLSIKYSSFAS